MIGSCNCPLTGTRLHPTVDYTVQIRLQLSRLIRANSAVYAPITIEEIVIVMINSVILKSR